MSGRTIAANLVKLNSVIIWKYYVIKPKKILICMFKIISTNIILFLLSQTLLMPNIRKPIDTDRTAVLYI